MEASPDKSISLSRSRCSRFRHYGYLAPPQIRRYENANGICPAAAGCDRIHLRLAEISLLDTVRVKKANDPTARSCFVALQMEWN
jgi:hypothetical protein